MPTQSGTLDRAALPSATAKAATLELQHRVFCCLSIALHDFQLPLGSDSLVI